MGKNVVAILGVAFLAAGIAGFIDPLTPDGELLGLAVNPVHNVIHLLTGIAALAAVASGAASTRLYAQVFGVVYAAVTILGFINGSGELLGLVAINQADNFFHLVVTAVLLYIGFGEETATPRRSAA